MINKFSNFNLSKELIKALDALDIKNLQEFKKR